MRTELYDEMQSPSKRFKESSSSRTVQLLLQVGGRDLSELTQRKHLAIYTSTITSQLSMQLSQNWTLRDHSGATESAAAFSLTLGNVSDEALNFS